MLAAAIGFAVIPFAGSAYAQDAAAAPTEVAVEAPAAEPSATEAPAAEEAATATPTVEERLADIEAYMNNVARPEKANGATSLVAGPGPGANAWQMVSTALVLFMTLPGLALFYGGLVRRKNVLSVLAQSR